MPKTNNATGTNVYNQSEVDTALALKQNIAVTLTDDAGSNTLPTTTSGTIISKIQSLRNNAKMLFNLLWNGSIGQGLISQGAGVSPMWGGTGGMIVDMSAYYTRLQPASTGVTGQTYTVQRDGFCSFYASFSSKTENYYAYCNRTNSGGDRLAALKTNVGAYDQVWFPVKAGMVLYIGFAGISVFNMDFYQYIPQTPGITAASQLLTSFTCSLGGTNNICKGKIFNDGACYIQVIDAQLSSNNVTYANQLPSGYVWDSEPCGTMINYNDSKLAFCQYSASGVTGTRSIQVYAITGGTSTAYEGSITGRVKKSS